MGGLNLEWVEFLMSYCYQFLKAGKEGLVLDNFVVVYACTVHLSSALWTGSSHCLSGWLITSRSTDMEESCSKCHFLEETLWHVI